jgi:solute carrier family 35 protein E3
MTTPVIMVIQTLWYNKTFSTLIQASLFVTCVGVMITSATDVQVNLIGTLYAAAGVLVTSLYQIWVQTGQKDLGVNSMQLLYYQAPISAVMLLVLTPLIDDMGKLRAYDWTASAVTGILVSAGLAFFVNLSTFLIIGKTSPVYVFFLPPLPDVCIVFNAIPCILLP